MSSKDVRRIEEHFSQLARDHGDSPEAGQWSDGATQRRRLEVLLELGIDESSSVLDFGCGTGALLDLLRERGFQGHYVGMDLAEPALELARARHPEITFERRDVLTDGVGGEFDFVFASGVFNTRVSDNWGLMTDLLRDLYGAARHALAFNALSTYVDWIEDHLWHADPGAVFGFCKTELSPAVKLRHDYEVKPGVVPYEFSVYVHRTRHAPRPNHGS